MRSFKSLLVWQKAHTMTLAVYRDTKSFPRDEQYGLTAQLRRASASVAANLAEGCGRRGAAEFGRFVQIALGSASEVEYHLTLALDLGYLATDRHATLDHAVVEVKRMLTGLGKKLMADR